MKIAIIGSSGFLGTKSKKILSEDNDVIGAGISDDEEFKLDATNKEEIRKFLLKNRPEAVLDTVALTSSLQCENNPALAESLNYLTAKNISEVCQEIGAWMVFMSSSYLFDGEKGNYNEKDQTSPINEYARTKIMAEKEVLKNPKSIILRVDVMYGYNERNKKNNGAFDMILSGNPIQLREPNQLRKPVFVEDVPRIMVELIKKNQAGIFHLAGSNKITMINFLKSLESLIRKDSIISIGSSSGGIQLKIPYNATFDTSKVESLGIKFTSLGDGLKKMKKDLDKN